MNKRNILLFFVCNVPFWVLYLVWDRGVRLATIFIALVAMWSLWVARRERHHIWTPKLKDIWLIQFLWCVGSVESNAELYYRHAKPSLAILLFDGILLLTIKGVFNGTKYTIDQS